MVIDFYCEGAIYEEGLNDLYEVNGDSYYVHFMNETIVSHAIENLFGIKEDERSVLF